MPLLIVGGTVIRQHNLKGCLGGNASQKPIKSTPDTVRYADIRKDQQLRRITGQNKLTKNHSDDYSIIA